MLLIEYPKKNDEGIFLVYSWSLSSQIPCHDHFECEWSCKYILLFYVVCKYLPQKQQGIELLTNKIKPRVSGVIINTGKGTSLSFKTLNFHRSHDIYIKLLKNTCSGKILNLCMWHIGLFPYLTTTTDFTLFNLEIGYANHNLFNKNLPCTSNI